MIDVNNQMKDVFWNKGINPDNVQGYKRYKAELDNHIEAAGKKYEAEHVPKTLTFIR
jgi:hypothetical protein